LFCGGSMCDKEADKATCCFKFQPDPPKPTGAPCSTLTCPQGYFPKRDQHMHFCAQVPCDVGSDTLACCNEALQCDLNCYGDGAKPVPLPGATGMGDDLMVAGLRLDECQDLCVRTSGCEGVVFGQAAGQCFGKRDIHLSKCQPDENFRTDVLRARPWGKCALMGDPHILPFDSPFGPGIDQVVPGTYWLVKSAELNIQARFGVTARFPEQASTVGIAVGGQLIGDNRLVLQYVSENRSNGSERFRVSWNGKEIFGDKSKTRDSVSEPGLKAIFDDLDPSEWHKDARHTIGGVSGKMPSYVFRFDEARLNIYILLGPDNFNAVIEAEKAPGSQDGYCGNFNCNQDDDSKEALADRGLAASIPHKLSLFHDSGGQIPRHMLLGEGEPAHNPVNDCDPSLKSQAEEQCRILHESEWQRFACVYDACARKEVSGARRDIALDAWQEELEDDELERGM